MYGMVYLRDNAAFRADAVVKLGITQNIVDRATTYVTGELHRGEWLQVWQVPRGQLQVIDKELKRTLAPLHVYKGGGTEFYSRELIDILADTLATLCPTCRAWSAEEIETADRTARIRQMPLKVKKLFSNLCVERVMQRLRANRAKRGPSCGLMRYYGPNEQQRAVLAKIGEFYTQHTSGRIHWACGLGKALLSIQIAHQLASAQPASARVAGCPCILIGVPSVALQRQMTAEVRKIYPRAMVCLVNSAVGAVTLNFATAASMVRDPVFYITTYHSSQHLVDYFKTNNIIPDFKIADEYHHIAGKSDGNFAAFDMQLARLSLYMSATPPDVDCVAYGPVIDARSVRWAIDNKKITDYCVIIGHSTAGAPCDPVQLAMRAMAEYPITHMLMYTNTTAEAEQVSQALAAAGFAGYNRALYSGSHSDLTAELAAFVAAERGIISCVYMFGEGFDLPKLNGVCVAAPMRSNTRIIQYLLRPNRLLKGQPDKLAHILLPSDNYESLRDIIANMRHADHLVGDKLRVVCPAPTNQRAIQPDKVAVADILKNLKLRLIHSGALKSGLTAEQDEYNYIRGCVAMVSSRAEYARLAPLEGWPEDPEDYFKITGQWVSWADFLSIKSNLSLEEWREFCRDKKITTPADYASQCGAYGLPKDPGDVYPNFSGFRNEFYKKPYNVKRR
jgi:superfamily II DNA or RNA helicase